MTASPVRTRIATGCLGAMLLIPVAAGPKREAGPRTEEPIFSCPVAATFGPARDASTTAPKTEVQPAPPTSELPGTVQNLRRGS